MSDEPVLIARCSEHGLHGEREECFVCGGPVEQVPMVPMAEVDQLRKALQIAEWDASVARSECDMRVAAAVMEAQAVRERWINDAETHPEPDDD